MGISLYTYGKHFLINWTKVKTEPNTLWDGQILLQGIDWSAFFKVNLSQLNVFNISTFNETSIEGKYMFIMKKR